MTLLEILSAARARRQRTRSRQGRAIAPIEALEGRQLLAASITLDPNTRVLTITGTDAADYILVTEFNNLVRATVDTAGTPTVAGNFARSSISSLVINALGGDDKLIASTATMPAYLSGGAGNDALYGGTADDRLEGGAGDDRLDGGKGADTYLFSGSGVLGSDTIVERFAQGSDTLDFSSFGRGVNIDLAVDTTTQNVAPGYLSLTISTQGDATNAESLENVIGSAYADTIRGNARYSTLKGNGGNDILEGRGGDDVLDGGDGDDTYVFGATGYLGADTIRDSSGRDTLDFSNYGQTVVIDLSRTDAQDIKSYFPNDDINDGATRLTLTLPNSIEDVKGSQSKDWIKGNALANALYGNGGDDILEGGAGNDTLDGGLGNDTYRYETVPAGGLGTDTIVERYAQGTDTLDFSSFGYGVTIDLATYGTAQTVVAGKLSLIFGGTGNDLQSFENVLGSNLADTIRGNARVNRLAGNGGNDILEGRGGNDRLEGGTGDDTYVFSGTIDLGTDTIVEDDDSHGPSPDAHDKLDFGGFGAAINVNLGTNSAQVIKTGLLSLVLSSSSGIEDVTGSAYADTIRGNARANTLRGGAGNDTIYGGAGNDILYGGDNDDLLYGEEGADTIYGEAGKDRLSGGIDGAIDSLYGGAGADIFAIESYYDTATQTWKNRDRFLDYNTAEGDTSI